MTKNQEKLFQAALKAQKRAYAPYSNAHIGAAVLMSDGNVYSGCNVENASYGGTVCAERVAIWKAVSEGAKQKIEEILVISDSDNPWPPCGFCRQVIAEFADEKTKVHIANLEKKIRTFDFIALLPEAFTPSHLENL